MTDAPITEELRSFLARYVRSIEHIEILCLLAENPNKAWTASEVFKAIQSSTTSVAHCLRFFSDNRLLKMESEDCWRFSPAPELAASVLGLVHAYRAKRVAITELIYTLPLDPVRDFADAFKIRKDKP